ncbi:hypothetical protein ACFOD9_06800 [Novosphingobium bradum]|uniref:Uncharacterized protein n=1 Tax=Novosphingobium bradum TaxID=1737444 RepID=A0ABV7ISQ2_9SPHN
MTKITEDHMKILAALAAGLKEADRLNRQSELPDIVATFDAQCALNSLQEAGFRIVRAHDA